MRTLARLLLLLALALPTDIATAQTDWRITGFATSATGFSGTLLFRNGQVATDSPILGLTSLQIHLAPGAPLCADRNACYFTSNIVGRIGNVDTRSFEFGGGARIVFDKTGWSEDSCVFCSVRNYSAPLGIGVLGCAAPLGPPGSISFYAGRTCLAEGFDGWFALPFEWRTFEAPPAGFAWTVSDLRAEFGYRTLGTENAFLVPEPASVPMLLSGLVGLAFVVRRRRTRGRRPVIATAAWLRQVSRPVGGTLFVHGELIRRRRTQPAR